MENKEVEELVHVDGKKMVADGLTKKESLAKALLRFKRTGKKKDGEKMVWKKGSKYVM